MKSTFKILLVLLLTSAIGSFYSQAQERGENIIEDIYGKNYTIDHEDSTSIIIFLKGAACTGCKKALYELMRERDIPHCKIYVVYSDVSGILKRKNCLQEIKDQLPEAKCLFFNSRNCLDNCKFKKLEKNCERSPCLVTLKCNKMQFFSVKDIFNQKESGYLYFKKDFLAEFDKIVSN